MAFQKHVNFLSIKVYEKNIKVTSNYFSLTIK